MVAKNTRAFTLIELLMVVSILGILFYIAVPRLQFNTLKQYKADTIARKIVTDLRRTRGLAIADAASNTNGYRLTLTSSSPYTGYKITNLNTSATVDTFTIDTDVTVTSLNGASVNFGPLGNVLTNSSNQITVVAQGRTFTITFIIATGTVKCVKS